MDNIFYKAIQEDASLSESSKKNYTSKILLLLKKGIDVSGEQKKIIEDLKKAYPNSNTTYKSYLFPVIKYREILEKPIEVLKEEYTNITKKYYTEQSNQISKKTLPNLEELKKNKRKIPVSNSQFKLMFSLYTEHPPVRNDYFDLKYKNYDTEKDNYFDKKSKKIVLNRFKTAKKYDDIEIPLLKPEITLINKLIKNSKDEYILHNTEGGLFDTKSFSKYLKREFEKISGFDLGSSDLRKIYVSSLEGKSLAERMEIAKQMGHTPFEAELFYKKVDIKQKKN